MFTSFAEIERHVLQKGRRYRVALAGAHDSHALESILGAANKGCAEPMLIGRGDEICRLLGEMGESADAYKIIDCAGERECAHIAMQMVQSGEADLPMKGMMQTSTFMRAILDKKYGFVPEKGLLSQACVLEFGGRLMVISDCAVNIAPTYDEKLKITQNAVGLAHRLGVAHPKVAVIAPLEMVNPAIPASVEAAMLSKAAERGQIKGCAVDGPLALDNAISPDAAAHKGVGGEVAGHADVLIMPDVCAGNIFAKSLTYFARLKCSGTLLGTARPVIVSSRTDTAEDKYYSILSALVQISD